MCDSLSHDKLEAHSVAAPSVTSSLECTICALFYNWLLAGPIILLTYVREGRARDLDVAFPLYRLIESIVPETRALGEERLARAAARDQRGPSGFRAYKYGAEPEREAFKALKGTPKSIINPDHIMDLVF